MNLKHDTVKIQARKRCFSGPGHLSKLKGFRKKSHINALVVVVCISRSVVHLGTKSVSGMEKSAISRCIVKLKRKIYKHQQR